MTEYTEQEIETRTDLFATFIEECDEVGVEITSNEFRLISEFATRDGIVNLVNQKVSNLADLKIEELSDREIAFILKRARLGLKRVIEQRAQFHKKLNPDGTITTFGPYFTNRKMKRHLLSRIVKRTKPSSRASEVVRQSRERRGLVTVA